MRFDSRHWIHESVYSSIFETVEIGSGRRKQEQERKRVAIAGPFDEQ